MSTNIRRGIYGQLAGDATLNGNPSQRPHAIPSMLGAPAAGYGRAIYHNQAPDDADFPFIIFNRSSGVPTGTFGTATVGPGDAYDPGYETDIWFVKAVDHNTTADRAETVANRIQYLLNDAALSISNGSVLYLRRQSDVEYAEVVDGEVFHHVGSQYRLVWEPS